MTDRVVIVDLLAVRVEVDETAALLLSRDRRRFIGDVHEPRFLRGLHVSRLDGGDARHDACG